MIGLKPTFLVVHIEALVFDDRVDKALVVAGKVLVIGGEGEVVCISLIRVAVAAGPLEKTTVEATTE